MNWNSMEQQALEVPGGCRGIDQERLQRSYEYGFAEGHADAEHDLLCRAPVDSLADDHLDSAKYTNAHAVSRTTRARDLGYARGYREAIR